MKIAIIGVSGFIGGHLLTEALGRNHHVIGISRRYQPKPQKNLTLHKMTIFDDKPLEEILKPADVIISAYNPGYYHVDQYQRYLDAYALLVPLIERLDKHLIVVIGATSLNQEDGLKVAEGFYPALWKKALEGPDAVFALYKNHTKITFVSPAAELIDTMKTKNYELGTDTLITQFGENSRISVQDLAHAIIDEAESPKYKGSRFTLGYTK